MQQMPPQVALEQDGLQKLRRRRRHRRSNLLAIFDGTSRAKRRNQNVRQHETFVATNGPLSMRGSMRC
ncbi:unnamed protein product [Ixodes pacificus]